MKLYLSTKAFLEIVDDHSISVGWIKQPTKDNWLETKKEIESLLGFPIVSWGAFSNPSTGEFWTKIGNATTCTNGEPLLVNLLDTN